MRSKSFQVPTLFLCLVLLLSLLESASAFTTVGRSGSVVSSNTFKNWNIIDLRRKEATTTTVSPSTTTTSLKHHAGPDEALLEFVGAIPPLNFALHLPVLWSMTVMLSIVALLQAWEEAIHRVRKALPQALMPVVDSMLAEVGGIGFVGLFLSICVTGGVLGLVVEDLSETFLGNDEILLETFEFLHTAFFEIGIGFFLVAGLTVADVLYEIQKITDVSKLALDQDGDGEVTLAELADALHVEALVVDEDGDGVLTEEECTQALRNSKAPNVWEQIQNSKEYVSAQALVIREQMIRQFNLPPTFQIEKYMERTFGHDLEEIVELSPITWLPLIPLFAIANSIDLSHNVVSAASSNSFVTSGEFITSPWVLVTRVLTQIFTVTWSMFNYWKMASIRNMLIATLVRDGTSGEAVLLKPRYLDEVLMAEFNSSPSWVQPIEKFFTNSKTRKPKNAHEELFGAAGADGPDLYRKSLKYQSWLCVAQIVFMGSEIVSRDVGALLSHSTAMDHPDAVLPELILFGFFTFISMAQLALAPQTFLCYSQATSLEFMTKDWALKSAVEDSKIEAWKEQEQGAETSLNYSVEAYMAGAGTTNGDSFSNVAETPVGSTAVLDTAGSRPIQSSLELDSSAATKNGMSETSIESKAEPIQSTLESDSSTATANVNDETPVVSTVEIAAVGSQPIPSNIGSVSSRATTNGRARGGRMRRVAKVLRKTLRQPEKKN